MIIISPFKPSEYWRNMKLAGKLLILGVSLYMSVPVQTFATNPLLLALFKETSRLSGLPLVELKWLAMPIIFFSVLATAVITFLGVFALTYVAYRILLRAKFNRLS